MAKCDKCGIVGFFQVGIGSTHAFTDASCGVACGGRIVADTPEAPKDPYAGMAGNNHLGQLAGSGMRQHAQLQASVMAQQAAMQAAMQMQLNQEKIVENAAIQVLKKRVAELENKLEAYKEGSDELNETTAYAQRRANSLSDECGALKTQNTELLAENARLRRGR
jgi:hypothetical protein